LKQSQLTRKGGFPVRTAGNLRQEVPKVRQTRKSQKKTKQVT